MEEELQVRDLIIKMRLDHKLNRTDMGRKIGVRAARVAQWEKGEINPHATVLFKMANALGKKITFI